MQVSDLLQQSIAELKTVMIDGGGGRELYSGLLLTPAKKNTCRPALICEGGLSGKRRTSVGTEYNKPQLKRQSVYLSPTLFYIIFLLLFVQLLSKNMVNVLLQVSIRYENHQ